MVIFSIPKVLVLWLGESNDLLAWSSVLIIISYIIALVLMPTYLFLMVRNRPHKALFLQFCNVVVNAILFFLLVPSFGYWGAVIAYSAAVIVTSAISIYYNIQYFGSTFIFAIENKKNLLLLLLVLLMMNSVLMIISVPAVAHIGLVLVLNVGVTFVAFQRLGILSNFAISNLRKTFSSKA
jgi:O-antigen/teichoic acid export membrane protein